MAEILSEFGHLVGLAGGNNIQATTMPTYSSVPLGTIVQYIGTTTADYINGYFYKATATGWEQHDTQPASNTGGHVIVNPSGTDMEQRASLQFVDANVTDDSTNDKTKIENIKVINSESELASASDGMYMGSYDDEAGGVISADMVMYDSETTVEDELGNKVDKVTGKGLSTNDYTNDEKNKLADMPFFKIVDNAIAIITNE